VKKEALVHCGLLPKKVTKFCKFVCLHFKGAQHGFRHKGAYIQKYNETGFQKSHVNPHFRFVFYKYFNIVKEFEVEREIC